MRRVTGAIVAAGLAATTIALAAAPAAAATTSPNGCWRQDTPAAAVALGTVKGELLCAA